MKNLFAFLFLFSHLNFTLFIPKLLEIDIIDAQGRQEDDINSLYEYIDQIVFGNHDQTPEDEDDDQAQTFQLSQIDQYPVGRHSFCVENQVVGMNNKSNYPLYLYAAVPAVYDEIQSPPPEA